MRLVLILFTMLVFGGLAYWFTSAPVSEVAQAPNEPSSAIVEISIPTTLSSNAQVGKSMFAAKCAACHGVNAVGQAEVAPPLVHEIYEPSHHGDEAFQRAVALGVRQHHWPFGNMPAIEGLTRGEVAMIVAYVRELQQANNIN